MTLQIGDAIGGGFRRAFTVSGGVLMAVLFAYMLVFTAATNALFLDILPPEAQDAGQIGLVLPIPPAVAGGILVVGSLFGFFWNVVSARALTREQAALSSFPSELATRRIGRAMLSAIGATIVMQIAITIGFLFLFVPGLFLAISFMFVVFVIAVEDERAMDSLSRSWELASGNRWRLLAILLVVGIGGAVIGGLASVFTVLGPVVGQVVTLAVSAVLAMVIAGVIAEVYLRLRDEDAGPSGDAETPDAAGTAV